MASSEQSDNAITIEEYMEVKRTLAASEAKCQQVLLINKELKQEVTTLNVKVSPWCHQVLLIKKMIQIKTDNY
jgi:hypothetical protein